MHRERKLNVALAGKEKLKSGGEEPAAAAVKRQFTIVVALAGLSSKREAGLFTHASLSN